jgi:alpha-glucosidase
MKPYRTFLLLALSFLLIRANQGHASQLQLSSNAPYLCAAVEGGDTANGTPVLAYSCSGSFGQQWNYVNGQLQGIGTANGESMCLDVQGNSGVSGTLVDLYQCNGGLNQQWWILPVIAGPNKGHAVVMAFGGGVGPGGTSVVCLDSSGGPSVGGGTQLVTNDCTNGGSQNWIMRRMEIEQNTSAPHFCVADEASKTANGTPVIAYSCSGAFNDEWNLNGGQIEGIGSENGTSKCLTGADSSSEAGTLVTLSTCNGSPSQHWWVVNSVSGSPNGVIMGYPSGLCLDSSGGPKVGGGTQLVVNECNGATSQNWNLH